MSRPAKTISPNADAETAFQKMRENGVRHLVVLEGREVAGVLSQRDIGGPGGAVARRGKFVRELMSESPVTAEPTLKVRVAANLMRGRALGCLPIVQDGRLVGIVTLADLLELVGRGLERPVVRGKRWTLRHKLRAGGRR